MIESPHLFRLVFERGERCVSSDCRGGLYSVQQSKVTMWAERVVNSLCFLYFLWCCLVWFLHLTKMYKGTNTSNRPLSGTLNKNQTNLRFRLDVRSDILSSDPADIAMKWNSHHIQLYTDIGKKRKTLHLYMM